MDDKFKPPDQTSVDSETLAPNLNLVGCSCSCTWGLIYFVHPTYPQQHNHNIEIWGKGSFIIMGGWIYRPSTVTLKHSIPFDKCTPYPKDHFEATNSSKQKQALSNLFAWLPSTILISTNGKGKGKRKGEGSARGGETVHTKQRVY